MTVKCESAKVRCYADTIRKSKKMLVVELRFKENVYRLRRIRALAHMFEERKPQEEYTKNIVKRWRMEDVHCR